MMNKNNRVVIAVFTVLYIIALVVMTADQKQALEEIEVARKERIEVIRLEQIDLELRIEDIKEQYKEIRDLYIRQGILLDDVRTRLHMELFEMEDLE